MDKIVIFQNYAIVGLESEVVNPSIGHVDSSASRQLKGALKKQIERSVRVKSHIESPIYCDLPWGP